MSHQSNASYSSVPDIQKGVQKIQWKDVNLSWKCKYRSGYVYERKLLADHSGEVCSGQLLAIMGPTGCGKTSLLNVLSGRLVSSNKLLLTGAVSYDDILIHNVVLQEKAVCVMQDDMLFPYLTVRETMLYAAYFHSEPGMSREELHAKANKAIDELNLSKSADTIIGSYFIRGVSGGEYKRTLIGKELMKAPSVIFLDEPTAGLDAHQALSVMRSMKTMVGNKRIVVAVIHQPRSSIVELFDRLLLLAEGRVVFFGPAKEAVRYFSSLGYSCPSHYNPADYLLDVLSISMPFQNEELGAAPEDTEVARAEQSVVRLESLATKWAKHTEKEGLRSRLTRILVATINAQNAAAEIEQEEATQFFISLEDVTRTTPIATRKWLRDFGKLCGRNCKQIYRDKLTLKMYMGTVLFFAVLLSLIYRDLGDSQKNISDRTGLLYFLLVNQAFSPMGVALGIFPNEKYMVNREILSGAYSRSAFYLSRVLCEIPNQVLLAVIYGTVIYWSVGLNPQGTRFLTFLLLVVMVTLVSLALGFAVSAASPSATAAHTTGPTILVVLLLFGGFYINKDSLPTGSTWLVDCSLFYWGFAGIAINEFEGQRFDCSYWDVACTRTGEEVISFLSFSDVTIGKCVWVLAVQFCVCLLLGYAGLHLNKERYLKLQSVEVERNNLNPDTLSEAQAKELEAVFSSTSMASHVTATDHFRANKIRSFTV